MKAIFNELIDHRSLTKEACKNVTRRAGIGKYNPRQMAAFMTVYMMRSITVDRAPGLP
jgi:anthranilate phosphoribosyltransferase